MNHEALSPEQLVNLLADKKVRNQAIVALVGGLTAAEMKNIRVTQAGKQALFAGLKHENSKVRWWCIQLMDHLADESYIEPLIDATFNDPLPKNRRHAIHALTCETCKPDGCALEFDLHQILGQIVKTDCEEKTMSIVGAIHESPLQLRIIFLASLRPYDNILDFGFENSFHIRRILYSTSNRPRNPTAISGDDNKKAPLLAL